MGRSARAAKAAPPVGTTIDYSTVGAEPHTPQTAAARQRILPAAAAAPAEEPLLPPESPLILPSTAAAVRTKERQLGASRGIELAPTGEGGAVAEEEEEEDLEAAADAALAAGSADQGPGLLQRAVDAATSVAAGAYAAAVPAVKQAVAVTADLAASGLGAATGAAEAVAETAAPDEEEEEALRGTAGQRPAAAPPAAQTGPARPPDAAATLAAAERAVLSTTAERRAAAAATTAAVLPASAARPAATGQGYFPTVGATAPAPLPEPTLSGEKGGRVAAGRMGGPLRMPAAGAALPPLTPHPGCNSPIRASAGSLSARRVVAERLTGLAEQARIAPASPAAAARGNAPRGAPGMVRWGGAGG